VLSHTVKLPPLEVRLHRTSNTALALENYLKLVAVAAEYNLSAPSSFIIIVVIIIITNILNVA